MMLDSLVTRSIGTSEPWKHTYLLPEEVRSTEKRKGRLKSGSRAEVNMQLTLHLSRLTASSSISIDEIWTLILLP